MDKQGKLEYKFLSRVVIQSMTKDTWDISDLKFLYKEFQFFIAKSNIEEISILRKGEVLLGQYCDLTSYSFNNCKDMLYKIVNSDELAIPIQIAIIGAILKISIEKLNMKENNNDDL